MDTVRYVLGLFVVVGLPPGIAWWYVVHPFVAFWRKRGAKVTMAVMGVFMSASVVGLALARNTLMGRDLGLNPILASLGVISALAGFRLAFARKKYLTNRILAGVPEVHQDADKRGELLDQGPYARVRHPRYIEVWFVIFGYAAIANWVGSWVVVLLTIPAIHAVVILEERELMDRFGDAYRDYAARVPRYIPSMSTSTTSARGT